MENTKPSAFAVHLFTGSGAVLALLALVAATEGAWAQMFAWLGLGLIVDGLDGPLARHFNVKKHASNWDGTVLDVVIDYLTYVFIPAYALIKSGMLPDTLALLAATVMVLTSVVYFADVRMKAKDNSFVGFPAVWHMPLLVLFVFQPPAALIFGLVVLLALAQFTSLKFIHPVRTERWRNINLPLLFVWFVLSALTVWADLNPGLLMKLLLLVVSVWLLIAGIVMQIIPGEPKRSEAS